MEDAVQPAQQAGLVVDYSGSVYPGWNVALSELPELIGIVIAFLILIVTFGALIAAGPRHRGERLEGRLTHDRAADQQAAADRAAASVG